MRSRFCAGAVFALVCLSGCGRPPEPPPPPSGKGWRILAEGAQEATMRTYSTGRGGSITVMSGSRPNDSVKEAGVTDEETPRQLTVGRNVSALSLHPTAASDHPAATSDHPATASEKP